MSSEKQPKDHSRTGDQRPADVSPDTEVSNEATSISRRRLLSGAGAIGTAFVFGKSTELAAQTEPSSPILDPSSDTSKTLGTPGTELGRRSPHEKISRFLRPGRPWTSGTPHEDLMGTITPSDLHFERHHSGVPAIDPAKYALLIHGMVDRPTVFSLDNLKRFPSVTSVHFLECSGNYPSRPDENTRPSRVAPLLSNSEWTGVPLRILLEEVGVDPDARWLVAEGQDAVKMNRSIPIEKAWDDAMIAYGQNGEPLRPEQGYPARLFNPGWEGNTSIKWLRRIEVTRQPSMTREETARYSEYTRGNKVRQFSFVMDARSLITSPGYPETIRPGFVPIQGIAWSGRGKISRVEISVDNRKTWQPAMLQEPVLSKSCTRFHFPWQWDGEPTVIWSRATDETEYRQPSLDEHKASRDGRRGYHMNFTVGWNVGADGQVFYYPQEDWKT